jgi:hypothetical protein
MKILVFLFCVTISTQAQVLSSDESNSASLSKDINAWLAVLENQFVTDYPNWENASDFLHNAVRFPSEKSRDVVKAQFLHVLQTKKLVISATGTSRTVGRDVGPQNIFTPALGRMMKEGLESLGILVKSFNYGMGDNPVLPSNICGPTILHNESNIILYEMTGAADDLELFIRNTISSGAFVKQPAIITIEPHCLYESLLGSSYYRSMTYDDGAELDITKYYEDFGLHTLLIPQELDRFVSPDSEARNSSMSAHRLMKEGKFRSAQKVNHPGPLCHKLIAYALAFQYGQLLKEASLEMDPSPAVVRRSQLPQQPYSKRCRNGTETVWVNHCSKYDSNPHVCWTTFSPIFREDLYLWNAVEDKAQLVDLREELLKNSVMPIPNDKWTVTCMEAFCRWLTWNFDHGYKDTKWVLRGTAESGPLSFKFKFPQENSLILCISSKLVSVQDLQARFFMDSKLVYLESITGWKKDPRKNCFETNSTFSAGDHIFHVEPFGTIELAQIVH